MADAPTETVQPAPDWAVKILQQALREYRYTGDYLPNPSEEVHLGLRRGDRRLGMLQIRHTMAGPRHLLRVTFESLDRKAKETLAARSLKQFQEIAPLIMERVCRYGCSVQRGWCDDCSQKERHALGQFRGLARTEEAPPEEPAATGGPRRPPGP